MTTPLAAAVLLLLAAICVARPSPAELVTRRLRGERDLRRLRPRLRRSRRHPPSPRQLAVAADLLAACLDAGAMPATALTVTGECLPESLGSQLQKAGRDLAAGAPVEQALPESGALAPLAAVFRRSAQTGSAITEQLAAVSEQLRADEYAARLDHARRAGVLSALPLAGCLLPAFLLLAVVPAVVGLGTGLLH